MIDPSCTPNRACVDGPCQCRGRASGLHALLSTYVRYVKASSEDAGAVFIRGHLAVLFGLLMRDSENKVQLLASLPGVSSRVKLGQLVDHAEDFVAFYASLEKRARKVESGGSRTTGGSGGLERNTAAETLQYLQALRDGSSLV